MKSKILLALLFAFSLKLSAQTGVGFHLGGSYYFGLKPMVNLGGNFIVPIKENPIEFGLSYHLPFPLPQPIMQIHLAVPIARLPLMLKNDLLFGILGLLTGITLMITNLKMVDGMPKVVLHWG